MENVFIVTKLHINYYLLLLAAMKRLLSGGVNPILIVSEFDPPVPQQARAVILSKLYFIVVSATRMDFS